MNSSKRSKYKVSKLSILLLLFVIFCLLFTSLYMAPVGAQPNPAEIEVMPFTRAMVGQSIDDTLNQLGEVYIYPEKVPDIRAEVTDRFKRGEYAAIQSNIEFAQTLGRDLREISGDMHLGILVSSPNSGTLTPALPAVTEKLKNNFAFQRLEILPDNVGLLKFNKFDSNPDTQLVADHAIGFLSRSDALIIDLRDCIGGSPQLVRYLISHFTAQETLLWTAVNRGEEQQPINTLEGIGPTRFKHDFPVFILTGPDTTSAAEVFTFIMQQTGKAVVVGEQTRGITHQVSAFPINDYFSGRFSTQWLKFPFAQNAFEGQGVTPDIAAPLATSLDVAHDQAVEILQR